MIGTFFNTQTRIQLIPQLKICRNKSSDCGALYCADLPMFIHIVNALI